MAKHKISLVVMALVGVPFFLASCKGTEPGAENELRVVKVEGEAICYNHTLAPFSFMLSEEGRPAGLLARDGDILIFAEKGNDEKEGISLPLCYRATDGTALAVAFEGGRMLLDRKTVSVGLKDEETWDWLKQASEEDLKGLRHLLVGQNLDAAQLEILKKVAKTNPAIDLSLEPRGSPPATEEGGTAPVAVGPDEVLRLFRPRFLAPPARLLSEEMEKIRLALEDVEVLLVDAKKEGNLDFLSHLPRLRTLVLPNWSPEQSPLPQNLKNLRSLILVGAESPVALASLADLVQLEQLTLVGGDVEDLGALAKFPRLKTLSLTGCEKVTDLGPLKDLPLEYLSFPPKISQEEFDAAVKDHPGLKAVELFNCENVKDIGYLKGLKDIKALVLISKEKREQPPPEEAKAEGEKLFVDLKEMKGLRLLVLPPWDESSAAEIADLQKALPDCLISAGKPLCLGSGWILALVPVAAGAWLVSRRRRG
ncbi:MAG: leucine-rich repeat domain-containing protein [Phycisphaerae bacterium]